MRPAAVETPTAEADIVPGWLDRLTFGAGARTKGKLPLAPLSSLGRITVWVAADGVSVSRVLSSNADDDHVLNRNRGTRGGQRKGELRKERKGRVGFYLAVRCGCYRVQVLLPSAGEGEPVMHARVP